MVDRSKQLQSTLVDGIPTFYVETGQTLRATLSFRAGIADETLARRGWIHLSEHLAMHGIRADEATRNASVGPLLTEFTVGGEAEDVVMFFEQLCEHLREPRLEHVGHERQILLAESARRAIGEFENHASYRFGARGFGLVANDELGLHNVSEEALLALIARSFVTGNAVLALNGQPPPGLRLDLPVGPRIPPPTSRHLLPSPPYHFNSCSGLAASSALCGAPLASTIAADLLARRIGSRLRDERGQSYSTAGTVERIDAHSLMVLVESDVTAEGGETVVDVMRSEYADLGDRGPAPDEIDAVRRNHLRMLNDDLTGEWQATISARAHLRGEQPMRQEDLRSALETLSAESMMPTFVELAKSFVASSPSGPAAQTDLPFERGLPDLPAPLDGLTFSAALAPLDPARLVVSDHLIEIADPLGNVRRSDLGDCVALVRFADGGRVIWSGHGDALLLEPTDWHDGPHAVAAVDRAVAPEVHVNLPERSDELRPSVQGFTPRQRLAVLTMKPAGYVFATVIGLALLGLLAALMFGAGVLPGGGAAGFVLFVILFTTCMTWLEKRRRKAARTSPAAPFPETTLQQAATPSSSHAGRTLLLISRSCTTSWTDWIHGELWLAPDALVRLRLDLAQTMLGGAGPATDLPKQAPLGLRGFDPAAVRADHSTNKYLHFDDITSAQLRRGILTGRLSVTMRTGEQHKLLWLRSDPAYMILRVALPQRIPGRLTIG